MFTKHT
jgi:hypothetical protein